jgi:hypothetical protein
MLNRNEQTKKTRKLRSFSKCSASSPSATRRLNLPVLFGSVAGSVSAKMPNNSELAAVINNGTLLAEISP